MLGIVSVPRTGRVPSRPPTPAALRLRPPASPSGFALPPSGSILSTPHAARRTLLARHAIRPRPIDAQGTGMQCINSITSDKMGSR